jgi:Mg/Co/Ni transporter MgtE
MRRKVLLGIGIALIPVLGAAAWLTWPEPPPPPSTADEITAALEAVDFSALSDEELTDWGERMAGTLQRLPPHEVQKLIGIAMADDRLRQRLEKLSPDQRERLANIMSEEQRARMMTDMAQGMVAVFRAMPKSLRGAAFRAMRERQKQRQGRSEHPRMTPQRMAEWQAATTPTQRAKFVRAMREMRVMMREAGVGR